MEFEGKTINGRNWCAEFNPAPDCLLKFELDSLAVLVRGACLGAFAESGGIVNKQQLHHRADGLGQDSRSETVIPFGVEPRIRRDIDFTDNAMRFVTDIGIGGKASYDDITLEPVEILGRLKRVGMVPVPPSGQAMPEPEWRDLTAEPAVVYRQDKPFLLCIVESEDGRRLTLGCGDDLWRWYGAADHEGTTAEFSVTANAAGVSIVRKPCIFPPEYPCGNRSWRYKWFMLWDDTAPAQPGDWEELTINPEELPDNILAIDEAGKRHSGMVCKYAPAWRKAFKKAIRSAAARGARVHYRDDVPVFCGDASHMDRNRKNFLPHWDMVMRLELYQWARQTLKAGGGDFKVE